MTHRLSVILCTHNPRTDYLQRTLEALRAQTLGSAAYELIIVDNASREPVAGRFDLSWHPAARVVVEPATGLTAARLRGIAEAVSELVVWVDDDNLLAPDYLAEAVRLGDAFPQLGVWGCGHFTPEWETPPAPGLEPYLSYLAVGRVDRARWSNRAFDFDAMPAGAGLCCRRAVVRRFADSLRTDPRRLQLGRIGQGLGGCEDFDLGLNAIDLGLGTGVFPSLRLTHLMPASRVREDYLLRLVEGHERSIALLMAFRDPNFRWPQDDWKSAFRRWRLRRSLGPVERRLHDARRRGLTDARHTFPRIATPPNHA